MHATGLWHRAAHVWLFDGDGRLYLQRRAPDKDACPDCWDLSVGEHLRPGEAYEQAAHRGLAEELGIAGLDLRPLGGVRRMRLELPEAGIRDYELQQSFRGYHDGRIDADAREVAEVRRITTGELRGLLAERRGHLTAWARQDAEELGLV